MSPERWQRVDRILQEALERDAAGRAAFLEQACGDDRSLRDEVEAFLAVDGAAQKAIAGAVQRSIDSFHDEQLGFA
jgi:hypothetical protein